MQNGKLDTKERLAEGKEKVNEKLMKEKQQDEEKKGVQNSTELF